MLPSTMPAWLRSRWEQQDRGREKLRAAVLAEWEFVDDRTARVRRLEVVRTVARRCRVEVNHLLISAVNRIVRDLGAQPINPKNRRMWRKLRRRAG